MSRILRQVMTATVVLATSAMGLSGAAAQVAPPTQITAGPGGPSIIGGEPASEGEYPFMARLTLNMTSGWSKVCGGTLISPDIILTAAHCTADEPSYGKVTSVFADIGKVDWRQAEPAGQRRVGKQWKQGGGVRKNDWAVVKLEQPYVLPSYLTVSDSPAVDNTPSFTAIGYGFTGVYGPTSNTLLEVDLDLVADTDSRCSESPEQEVCAGGDPQGAKDTCSGDSGGPLMARREGQWVQVGMTSWGYSCAKPNTAGHYAQASAFIPQLRSAVTELGGQQFSTSSTPTPTTTTTSTPTPTTTTTSTPTPTTTSTPTPSANLLVNPGFEAGNTGWAATAGAITNAGTRPAHTGDWKLAFVGTGKASTKQAQQSVTVPRGTAATLSYWERIDTAETTKTTSYDSLRVQVTSGGTTKTVATSSNLNASSGYVRRTIDMSAYLGQTVTLLFAAREDGYLQTSFVIDDTELLVR